MHSTWRSLAALNSEVFLGIQSELWSVLFHVAMNVVGMHRPGDEEDVGVARVSLGRLLHSSDGSQFSLYSTKRISNGATAVSDV
jgi:hypothetical protein